MIYFEVPTRVADAYPPNICVLIPVDSSFCRQECRQILPSFDVHMQGVTTSLYGLSMFASESPEWAGTLPLGQAVHNYTLSIACAYFQRNV